MLSTYDYWAVQVLIAAIGAVAVAHIDSRLTRATLVVLVASAVMSVGSLERAADARAIAAEYRAVRAER